MNENEQNEINDKNDDNIIILRKYNNNDISRSNNKTSEIIEIKNTPTGALTTPKNFGYRSYYYKRYRNECLQLRYSNFICAEGAWGHLTLF